MTELVFAPSVHIVARTMISPDGLENWAQAHNLTNVLHDDQTPLGHLWTDLDGRGDLSVSLDALPEFGGRFCYRSFVKGRDRDAYIANIIEMEHGSVLEHASVSFAVSGVSRSLTHELVRHRQGNSPSQESQRYVDASEIRFVVPPLLLALAHSDEYADGEGMLHDFMNDCESALDNYRGWIAAFDRMTKADSEFKGGAAVGVKLATMRKKRILEAARAVLPNAAETRLIWTMNMRSARFVCALRGGEGADLEIRRLACEFTRQLKAAAPIIFSDFEIYTADDGFEAVRCAHPKV